MAKEVPFTALFLLVKMLDIGLTTVYFIVIGLVAAKLFDMAYGKFNKEDYKHVSKVRLFLEIAFHIFLIGIAAYVLRNVVGFIPFPLEGVAGFQHKRLKELGGGAAMPFILYFLQDNLHDKTAYFAESVFGINPKDSASAELVMPGTAPAAQKEPVEIEGEEEFAAAPVPAATAPSL
jgi:hypothetical protein